MIAKIYSAIPQGYDGHLVTVEGDSNRGLPGFNIVGMANKTITESRERVRAAIINSGFTFPARKVTINLAPAELSKDGAHLDLPIALAILVLSQQLLPEDVSGCVFVGELSLDGFTKPVRGIINVVEAAKNAGFHTIYVPQTNLATACLITGMKIIGVTNLLELFLHLKGTKVIQPSPTSVDLMNTKNSERTHRLSVVKNTPTDTSPSLWSSIQGHALAKRALIIALAGQHNLLFTGPPGSGKTMLAHAAQELQPPPSTSELVEITKIHALVQDSSVPLHTRPFRSPHHSASLTSIIGGGSHIQPGEISLAHRGILFLDELPEYHRNILEALRQPLEQHSITINRAHQHLTYPAHFMLIATMNPCPCGYFGSPDHPCQCTPTEIRKYQNRLSGPILDRIDLIVPVSPVQPSELVHHLSVVKNTQTDTTQPKCSTVVKNTQTDSNFPTSPVYVKNTIIAAQQLQLQRSPHRFNASLSSAEINQSLQLAPTAENLLTTAARKLTLSTRTYYKIIKVAQTIADLSASPVIQPEHISEALSYRFRGFG